MPVCLESTTIIVQERWPAGALPRVLESSTIHKGSEAAEYDDLASRYAWLINQPFVDLVAKTPLEHARVLDIGTGPGLVPVELAKRKPGWEIWALDASEDMLERGRAYAQRAGVAHRVHFVHGDATELPLETGFFDLTVSNYLLHHLAVPARLFDEAARVTRGGGRVIVKDLLRHPRWRIKLLTAFCKLVLRYSPEQQRMYAESIAAGLTLNEVRMAMQRSQLCLGRVRGFRGLDYVVTA